MDHGQRPRHDEVVAAGRDGGVEEYAIPSDEVGLGPERGRERHRRGGDER